MRLRLTDRGFSVIEVLISFTVLTVAMLALLGLMPVAARSQSSSHYQNRALYIAQEIMDQVMGDPAKRTATFLVAPGSEFPGFYITNPLSPPTTANGTVISSWLATQIGPTLVPVGQTVTPILGTVTNGRRLVTVRVLWQEETGGPGGNRGRGNASVGAKTMRSVELRSWIPE